MKVTLQKCRLVLSHWPALLHSLDYGCLYYAGYQELNNGNCFKGLNKTSCAYDAGDCMSLVATNIPGPNGCESSLYNNGKCDGINNNENCSFDSGDCCLPLIDDTNCVGNECVCQDTNYKHRTFAGDDIIY